MLEPKLDGAEQEALAKSAAILSDAVGRSIRHQPIAFSDFHAAVEAVADPTIADVFTQIARETLDGRNAHLTDGVQRALGRPPRDFADYAKAVAAAGVWDVAA